MSSLDAKLAAYSLLINKGLIRIGLPMPKALQFEVIKVDDPYDCTTNSSTGLTDATTGIVSIYRRPLPATNLGFLSTHHVGWPRARSCESGGRCDSDPRTGDEYAVKNPEVTDRQFRERNLHGAEL